MRTNPHTDAIASAMRENLLACNVNALEARLRFEFVAYTASMSEARLWERKLAALEAVR